MPRRSWCRVTCDWLLGSRSAHQIGVCLAGAAEEFRAAPAEERLERPGPRAVGLKLAVERVAVIHHRPEWCREATADLDAEVASVDDAGHVSVRQPNRSDGQR